MFDTYYVVQQPHTITEINIIDCHINTHVSKCPDRCSVHARCCNPPKKLHKLTFLLVCLPFLLLSVVHPTAQITQIVVDVLNTQPGTKTSSSPLLSTTPLHYYFLHRTISAFDHVVAAPRVAALLLTTRWVFCRCFKYNRHPRHLS